MVTILYKGVGVGSYSLAPSDTGCFEYGQPIVKVLSARNRDIKLYLSRRVLEVFGTELF